MYAWEKGQMGGRRRVVTATHRLDVNFGIWVVGWVWSYSERCRIVDVGGHSNATHGRVNLLRDIADTGGPGEVSNFYHSGNPVQDVRKNATQGEWVRADLRGSLGSTRLQGCICEVGVIRRSRPRMGARSHLD